MSYEKILFCSALAVFYEFTVHNGYMHILYMFALSLAP